MWLTVNLKCFCTYIDIYNYIYIYICVYNLLTNQRLPGNLSVGSGISRPGQAKEAVASAILQALPEGSGGLGL